MDPRTSEEKRRDEEFAKISKKIIRNSKPELYSTSNGMVLLNPLKRILKNKPYSNPEFAYIAKKEMESAIEALSPSKEIVEGENKLD